MRPILTIWAALMVSVASFVGIAWFLGSAMHSPMPEVFVWVMLGVTANNVVLSRVVPRIAKGNDTSKAIIGFALAESACLVSGVAWLLTGDSRALAGIGIGFLALASLFPRGELDGETVPLVPPR